MDRSLEREAMDPIAVFMRSSRVWVGVLLARMLSIAAAGGVALVAASLLSGRLGSSLT